jgi:hypothetical protein
LALNGDTKCHFSLAWAHLGFVLFLCIGNYYRAKRAMERQRQRRLARLSNGGGNGVVDSPRSHPSSATSGASDEHQKLLPRRRNIEENDLLLKESTGPQGSIMRV